MLPKNVLCGGGLAVSHPDAVRAWLQQERHALPAKQVHAPPGVARFRLEKIQMVQLAESLVDAATQAADGDDVRWSRTAFLAVVLPDVRHGLAEVGRLLIRVTDDLGLVTTSLAVAAAAACLVVGPDGGTQAVEISYDEGEVVLEKISVSIPCSGHTLA